MASRAYSGYSFRRRLEDDCMSDTHEGGCLCGKVRYRLTGNPDETEGAGICHCTNCRRRTGSAFGVQVFFPKDAFQLTKGELKTYEYRSDVDRWVRTEFCRNCGTTMTWLAEWNPELRSIAFGTLDNPSRIKPPQWAIYGRSAIPWIAHPRNIDVYDTNPYVNEGEQPKRSS